MAKVLLSSKAVGSIVKLNVNGTARNFIVVHQGRPSTSYDSSCDDTWLLMEDIYESREWHSSLSNSYSASSIHSYLNSTFLNLLDSNIKSAVKAVRIPYTNGTGPDGYVASGYTGLSTQVFLLSHTEIGLSGNLVNVEGATLSYFNGVADSKRVAKLNGTATYWWLRSPYINIPDAAWYVYDTGFTNYRNVTYSHGIRPAFVLPGTLMVNDDGTVIINTAPTITSTSGTSGVNLGTKNDGFDLSYTVSDADGDTLTVTEKLDGVTKRTFTTAGGTYAFESVNADNFQRVLNGTHTLSVTVSDGTESVTFTATFTKSVTSASITLASPLTVEGDITLAVAAVTGSIPADADYTFEVTNNANDTTPVWQDVTEEMKNGGNIVFENTTCKNGAAFNFRLNVKRGASGTGGYIEGIAGAFQ